MEIPVPVNILLPPPSIFDSFTLPSSSSTLTFTSTPSVSSSSVPIGNIPSSPSVTATTALAHHQPPYSSSSSSSPLPNTVRTGTTIGVKVTLLTSETFTSPNLSTRSRQVINDIIDTLGTASAYAQKLGTVITTSTKFGNVSSPQRLYIAYEQNKAIGFIKVGHKQLFISVPTRLLNSHSSSSSSSSSSSTSPPTESSSPLPHRNNNYTQYSNESFTSSHRMIEIEPLCILDFFVFESYRRYGVGKILFETMLGYEGYLLQQTKNNYNSDNKNNTGNGNNYNKRPSSRLGSPFVSTPSGKGTNGNTTNTNNNSTVYPLHPAKLAFDRPSHMFLSFLQRHYRLSNYTPQANNYVVYHDYFTSPVYQTNGNTVTVKDTSTENPSVDTVLPSSTTVIPSSIERPVSARSPFATEYNTIELGTLHNNRKGLPLSSLTPSSSSRVSTPLSGSQKTNGNPYYNSSSTSSPYITAASGTPSNRSSDGFVHQRRSIDVRNTHTLPNQYNGLSGNSTPSMNSGHHHQKSQQQHYSTNEYALSGAEITTLHNDNNNNNQNGTTNVSNNTEGYGVSTGATAVPLSPRRIPIIEEHRTSATGSSRIPLSAQREREYGIVGKTANITNIGSRSPLSSSVNVHSGRKSVFPSNQESFPVLPLSSSSSLSFTADAPPGITDDPLGLYSSTNVSNRQEEEEEYVGTTNTVTNGSTKNKSTTEAVVSTSVADLRKAQQHQLLQQIHPTPSSGSIVESMKNISLMGNYASQTANSISRARGIPLPGHGSPSSISFLPQYNQSTTNQLPRSLSTGNSNHSTNEKKINLNEELPRVATPGGGTMLSPSVLYRQDTLEHDTVKTAHRRMEQLHGRPVTSPNVYLTSNPNDFEDHRPHRKSLGQYYRSSTEAPFATMNNSPIVNGQNVVHNNSPTYPSTYTAVGSNVRDRRPF